MTTTKIKSHRSDDESLSITAGERLDVYSVKQRGDLPSIWTRCGSAWVNRDGSLNVRLDVLPLDGALHIRRPPVNGRRADDGKATPDAN